MNGRTNTFGKSGIPIFVMSLITVALFAHIALKQNLLDNSGTLDETLKKIIVNVAFFIAVVIFINSFKRKKTSESVGQIGSVLVNGFIALLLAYFSITDFSPFCEDNSDSLDKHTVQKFASFGFVYLLVWKIITPLFNLTRSSSLNNASMNSKRSYGIAGIYLLATFLLLFMKLYKTGDTDNPNVFNNGENKPSTVNILQNGGLVASIMMLLAMMVLTINDSKNAFKRV